MREETKKEAEWRKQSAQSYRESETEREWKRQRDWLKTPICGNFPILILCNYQKRNFSIIQNQQIQLVVNYAV